MTLEASDKRLDWVDLCKFIGIYFMVWGHSGLSPSMDKYIHSFHMPVFFFISGYLFDFAKQGSFGKYTCKKLKNIILPYFIFAIINYAYWILLNIKQGIHADLIRPVLGTLWVNTVPDLPHAGALWFLTCLLFVELGFYLLIRLMKNKLAISLILVAFSIIGYVYSILELRRLPYGIDTAFTALVFYGAGYLLRNTGNAAINRLVAKPNAIILIVLFIISCVSSKINIYTNMRLSVYGNYFLYYMAALSGILFYFLLSSFILNLAITAKIPLTKALLYLGKNSLLVLCLNQAVIRTLKLLENHFGIRLDYHSGFLNAIIVLIVSIPIIYIINRYFPFLSGKRYPLRKQSSSTM